MYDSRIHNTMNDFKKLKSLLDVWPEAVPNSLICDVQSKKQKSLRASEVVSYLLPPLKGKKVLDFGCGEGHMAREAGTLAAYSVGYDINAPEDGDFEWEKEHENTLLTTDPDKVEGKFDVVLVYDVLDHVVGNIVPVIHQIIRFCKPGGVMIFRCHPWCGRHGGHLYQQINKAFVHLVFTDDELESMGYEVPHNKKVCFPLATYRKWLKNAGFKITDFSIFSSDEKKPEGFFRKGVVLKRIQEVIKKDSFPEHQLRQSFVDFSIMR